MRNTVNHPAKHRCPFRIALACLGLSLQAHAGGFGNPDQNWVEGHYELPPSPQAQSLLPVEISAQSPNRFYVDAGSLTVGEDGVVRYVLVVETPGGARNASFEGIRCVGPTHRLYASQGSDGSWRQLRQSEWRPIMDNSYNRAPAALAQTFFCLGSAHPQRVERIRHQLEQAARQAPALGTQ